MTAASSITHAKQNPHASFINTAKQFVEASESYYSFDVAWRVSELYSEARGYHQGKIPYRKRFSRNELSDRKKQAIKDYKDCYHSRIHQDALKKSSIKLRKQKIKFQIQQLREQGKTPGELLSILSRSGIDLSTFGGTELTGQITKAFREGVVRQSVPKITITPDPFLKAAKAYGDAFLRYYKKEAGSTCFNARNSLKSLWIKYVNQEGTEPDLEAPPHLALFFRKWRMKPSAHTIHEVKLEDLKKAQVHYLEVYATSEHQELLRSTQLEELYLEFQKQLQIRFKMGDTAEMLVTSFKKAGIDPHSFEGIRIVGRTNNAFERYLAQ